jgi:hypothetical protein
MPIHKLGAAIKDKSVSSWHLVWRGNPEEAKKPVPHWFHFPLQIIVVGFVLYWHWKLPLPNKAVLALAAVAALMVLAEMRPIHKAIYVVLIVALVYTENRAINEDRSAFEKDQREQRRTENEKFQGIADKLSAEINGMIDLKATASQTERNIEQIKEQIKLGTADKRKAEALLDQAQLANSNSSTPKVNALALSNDMLSYFVVEEKKNPNLSPHKSDPESLDYLARDTREWFGEAIEGFHQKFGDRIKTTLASFPESPGYAGYAAHDCHLVDYRVVNLYPIRNCALSIRALAENGH